MPDMKKLFYLSAIAAAFAVCLGSCKTTEANYRAAYERAVSRQNEGIDSATVEAIAREEAPRTLTVAQGVAFPLVSKFVRVVDGGGGTRESLKKYSVVVAVFRQLFNASSMRGRLVDTGRYPSAFVVQAGEEYYVIAASADEPEQALSIYQSVKADKSLVMKSPLPWVLMRPR